MRTVWISLAALGMLAAAPAGGGEAAAAFERFKALEGTWEATDSTGAASRLSYEVVARGTAVLERFEHLAGDHGSPMITVYHLDGRRLMLTHYCMAGNQPRMKAVAIRSDEIAFDFQDATNLAAPAEGHMRTARYRFEGADRFTTEWTFWKDGKASFTEVITAKRAAPAR